MISLARLLPLLGLHECQTTLHDFKVGNDKELLTWA